MFEWISDSRASIALVVIIGLGPLLYGLSGKGSRKHAGVPRTRYSAILSGHVADGTGQYAASRPLCLSGSIIHGVRPALCSPKLQMNCAR